MKGQMKGNNKNNGKLKLERFSFIEKEFKKNTNSHLFSFFHKSLQYLTWQQAHGITQ